MDPLEAFPGIVTVWKKSGVATSYSKWQVSRSWTSACLSLCFSEAYEGEQSVQILFNSSDGRSSSRGGPAVGGSIAVRVGARPSRSLPRARGDAVSKEGLRLTELDGLDCTNRSVWAERRKVRVRRRERRARPFRVGPRRQLDSWSYVSEVPSALRLIVSLRGSLLSRLGPDKHRRGLERGQNRWNCTRPKSRRIPSSLTGHFGLLQIKSSWTETPAKRPAQLDSQVAKPLDLRL